MLSVKEKGLLQKSKIILEQSKMYQDMNVDLSDEDKGTAVVNKI
jgi:hypothetical protein